MNKINLCFGIKFSNEGSQISSNIKDIYLNKFKKIFSFLCTYTDIRLSLYIPGVVLEWLKVNHPEVITILSERTSAGQIELIGGGFFEPILPLISPTDRVTQIENLTTLIRKLTGKKPRGVFLNESIWDPSLISTFNTCAMEYTFLDSRLMPKRGINPAPSFVPHIVENLGRTTTVIPLHKGCIAHTNQQPSEYLRFLQDILRSANNSIIAGFYSVDDFLQLISNKWFDSFLKLIENNSDIKFALPYDFLKKNTQRNRCYIPSGCESELAVWATEPYAADTHVLTESLYPTAQDFLTVYEQALFLYSHMVYTSTLVNQCRGDKVRKKAAREHVFQAQNYSAYIFNGNGGVRSKSILDSAYQNLIEAEKLVREASGFSENTTSFDFMHNGNKEYVCSFDSFNAYIMQTGGMLFELDIISNSKNYCNASRRFQKTDKTTDLYNKKMFVDHLLSKSDFNKLSSGKAPVTVNLPTIKYSEHTFNRSKSSIQLIAECLWGEDNNPVIIKKNYNFNNNGVLVQYILKNNGVTPIKAKFAVEQNISFSGDTNQNVLAEIIAMENKDVPDTSKPCYYKDGVSLVQLEDLHSNVQLLFELNENSTYSMYPYHTQCINKQKIDCVQYEAHTCVFYWDIDLQPGYETEKNISLTIIPGKKKTVAKKSKK